MSDDPPVLEAALRWDRLGVGVVPVLDFAPGQLVPGIHWQQEGPLRGEQATRAYWAAHPDAQLAILLDNSATGGPRLGCIDDDSGKHDTGGRTRPRPLGGYRESTRNGGTHDLFRYTTRLPPDIPSRVTEICGFVDVLVGGILYIAPTVNAGVGAYMVVSPPEAGIPEFASVGLAIDAASDWLRVAWIEKAREGNGSGGHRGPVAGPGKDFTTCYRIAARAIADGATDDQVREAVGCDHPEWAPQNIHRTTERIRRRLAQLPARRFDDGVLLAEVNAEPAGPESEPVDPDSEPAEPVPTDLVVALEETFAPDWENAIHRTWFNPTTGRPTHACTPRRVVGWLDRVSNEEKVRRLLRERKLYIASRGGRTIRAYRAAGPPFDRRRRFGPRGIARRIGDALRDHAVDRWVVVLPGADNTADVFLFVFDDLDNDGADRLLREANARLGELFGMDVMLAHPFRRDRRRDEGHVRIPSADEVEPEIRSTWPASHSFPVLEVDWASVWPLAALRRFFLSRLVVDPVDAPRFKMGVCVVGERSDVSPSFHLSTLIGADDVPEAEVDPASFANEESARSAIATLRNRHGEKHAAFLATDPVPEALHVQACDDCDAYAELRGIDRPLPMERPTVEAAEYWGQGGRAWADGYDPPG